MELGEYTVESRKASHKSAYTKLVVTAQTMGKSITLNAPVPIYGSLMVQGTPAGTSIYVDGQLKGKSPIIVNDLLIGSHKVCIEKDGYEKHEKTIQVTEGQEEVVKYELVKETPKTSTASSKTTSSTTAAKGIHNGREYVDLGLSVKWATCNLGADSPEDYGNYFAWGETKPKRNSTYSYPDPFTILLSDDAAHVNWGGSWRMPTVEEQEELVTKCTLKWTTQNGVSGYKVTSKRNGNSIFLPAAGYHTGLSIAQAGDQGYYWSSSRAHYSHMAMLLYFYSSNMHLFDHNRYDGCSVRPVCK